MRFDRILLAIIALIFVVHTLAVALSWYDIYTWIDIPMHMAAGFFLGLLFMYMFLEKQRLLSADISLIHLALLGLGFVAWVGVCWEVYEYLSYVFVMQTMPFGSSVPGVHFDVLKDLFDDLFGGAVAISLYLLVKGSKAYGPKGDL